MYIFKHIAYTYHISSINSHFFLHRIPHRVATRCRSLCLGSTDSTAGAKAGDSLPGDGRGDHGEDAKKYGIMWLPSGYST